MRQLCFGLKQSQGLCVTRIIFAILIYTMTTSLGAEVLSLPHFRMEVEDGWQYTSGESRGDNWGEVVSLQHPAGTGNLKLVTYEAPAAVSKDRLRKLTNLEASTQLGWENWGDYAGYHYSYTERGTFYRQWWLANRSTVIFATYQCDPASQDVETESIEKMIRSISVDNR
jgi:hypothetical protein